MDGVPTGRSLADVEATCRFLDLPVDEWTLTAFQTVETIWLKQINERRKAAEKK